MSDAGISTHIAQLRRQLEDQLFTRTAAGLEFTPGGLRLATRAVEILGLQQQTAIEVGQAAHGRRLLQVAASTTFAEHAAPGLIELFASRAKDLAVELSVRPISAFRELITARVVDVALGGRTVDSSAGNSPAGEAISVLPFLNYQIIAVTAPHSPIAGATPTPALLREQQWVLGPSAGSAEGVLATMLRALAIPETHQRIFQSDAAALAEVRRSGGITVTVGFAVAADLSSGRLIQVKAPGLQRAGQWCAYSLPEEARQPAVSELLRFITTARCTQAMIRGTGVGVTRFRPKVHVTLWS